jgi:hypothetical protein
MGQLLTGQAALPNKIGTTNIDSSKLLNNTFQSQGFRLTNNTLSNISKLPDNTNGAVNLDGKTAFDKVVKQIFLEDKTGYPIVSLLGSGAWVPYGASVDEASKAVGALTTKKFAWAVGQTIANTLDIVVTGGTGSTAIRLGKATMTVKQAQAAALGARIAFGALNYRFNYGLDWGASLGNSAAGNINILTVYRPIGLLPKSVQDFQIGSFKPLSYIAHTSHNFLHAIETVNNFGTSNSMTLKSFTAYRADGGSGNILNFKGTVPGGGKWDANAIRLTISPDKIYNRGLYELNKEIGFTPYNILNGKFGVSDWQYKAKNKLVQNLPVFQDAIASVGGTEPPTSEDSYKKIYGKQFLDITQFFGQLEQASDPNSAVDVFKQTRTKIQKSGLSPIGRALEYESNLISLAENQRLNNQYSIIEINEYQKKLNEVDWKLALYQLPKTIQAVTALNIANAGLKISSIALSSAQQILTPTVDIVNSLFVRSQVYANNAANAVANMLGLADTPRNTGAVATAKKTPKPKTTESAKVGHSLPKAPIFLSNPPNKSGDMIALDAKYIQRNMPILREGKEWEKQEATVYLNNKRAEILSALNTEKANYTPSFLTGATKKGTPNAGDKERIRQLQQDYIKISNFINQVGTAIDKGTLKYDYKRNTFNNQKIW